MTTPKLYDRYGREIDLAQVARDYKGRKIEGIRSLKEETGLDLKEAKAAFEFGEALVAIHYGEAGTPASNADVNIQEIADRYRDEKIAGIKYLRELTGWGLKETKDALDVYWNASSPPPSHFSPTKDDGSHLEPQVELPPPKRGWMVGSLLALAVILLLMYLTWGKM